MGRLGRHTARWRRWGAGFALAAGATLGHAGQMPIEHLRIVGGLAGLNQYTRFEEPFWRQELPRLSQGRASAEIVPFDKAGLGGEEMLRVVQMGAVPFGTVLLSRSSAIEPELAAPDLAGLNPDFDALRRSVAAFRPRLASVLRDRYGAELLAVYVYPAQVTFCTRAFATLADLAGRRVRVSSASQADFVAALGAQPVQTPLAQVVPSIRSGTVDCAITGTMSGNTIGLHELTSHVHTMAVNWGMAAFVAHAGAWNELSAPLRALLERELPKLEQRIWQEAERETREGLACNAGQPSCVDGRKGRMTVVAPTPDDQQRRRDLLQSVVVPAWVQRCGAACAAHARTLAARAAPPR